MKEYKKPSLLDAASVNTDRIVPFVAAAALLGGYVAGRLVAKAVAVTAIEPDVPRLECVLA